MAAAVASLKMAQNYQKALSTEFVSNVRDQMLESLQSAAHECVEQAAQRLNEEMARLQGEREQEVLDLQQQLKVLSECQRVMLSQDRQSLAAPEKSCSESECQRVMLSQNRQSLAAPEKSCSESECQRVRQSLAAPEKSCSDLNGSSEGSTLVSGHNESRTAHSTCSDSLLAQTPARHITLVMTPTSSQTCSSSSCHSSPTRCAKALPTYSPLESKTPTILEHSTDMPEVDDAPQQHPSGFKLLPELPESPSKQQTLVLAEAPSDQIHRKLVLAEVTPPRPRSPPAPTCEKRKSSRPVQFGGMTYPDQAVTGPEELSNALNRIPTGGKVDCESSPHLPAEPSPRLLAESPRIGTQCPHLPAEPSSCLLAESPRIGTQCDHVLTTPRVKSAQDDLKLVPSVVGNASITRTPSKMLDKSPTVLEPDTIEVLRAALVNELEEASCTPKPSPVRAPVLLPPAAMQGRYVAASCDTPQGSLLVPQGSPLVRPKSDTPREGSSSSTGRHHARTPKLSPFPGTPAGTGASTHASASAQDTQGIAASPPRQHSELKSRRLSWPSTPKQPVRAVVQKIKHFPENDDSATPNHRSDSTSAVEIVSSPSEKVAGGPKLQAIAPALAPALPKTMPEVPEFPKAMPEEDRDDKSGTIDGSTLHGIASPLRRRWLGVLSGAPSTSAVTPKPPAQRLDPHRA